MICEILSTNRIPRHRLTLALLQEVFVPPEVAAELARPAGRTLRFAGLKLPAEIKQQSPSSFPDAVRNATGLDLGEAAALSLAVEIHADAVLIDERRGYEVAVQLGLRTVGILGMLLRAKSAGFLPAVKPVLDALQRDAGFWLSESLRKQVLQAAAES